MRKKHHYATFETHCGFVALAWSDEIVRGLRLPSKTIESAQTAILRRLPDAQREAPNPFIANLIADIIGYFHGERVDFSGVQVDLGTQTPFSTQIYDEIRNLCWGETTSYGAVAKVLNAQPQAARDVGHAMANNPVPLIVPCHRVLGAGRRIGGFSAPGGSNLKLRMLELEGVVLEQRQSTRPKETTTAQGSFEF